jgi:hypothetical protein
MASPQRTTPFTKPKVLIGEGRDEEFFLGALVAHLGLSDVQVEQYGGKSSLSIYLREFNVRPRRSPVVALGITRDADSSVAPVFQSISTLLGNNGLSIPSAPGHFAPGPPRIGVYIMPDNLRAGMLEDLCLDAVQTDGAVSCVTDFFQCVTRNTKRQPNPIAKGRVHAWLASQDEPDLRLARQHKRVTGPGTPAPLNHWSNSCKPFSLFLSRTQTWQDKLPGRSCQTLASLK